MRDGPAANIDIDGRLKEEALRWMEGMRGSAERAGGFVLDQAPEALRELVAVGRFEHTTYVLVGLLLVAGAPCFARWAIMRAFRSLDDESARVAAVPIAMGTVVAVIIGCILVRTNFHGFATAWFGPRIYILEELARLAGKAVAR